jgi:hypothetical protein
MVEAERLALWAVDCRYVRQHIHRQIVDDLSRVLGVERLFGPIDQSLEVDFVELRELW